MTAALPRVFLNPGGDRRIAGGHPWAYSNEIRMDAAAKALAPGGLVVLNRVDGKPVGVGTFNPHCLIAFRLFAPDPAAAIDSAFIRARLERALSLREALFDGPFYRLVHGEADGLPGLVADRFGDVVVVQAGSAGMEALLEAVVAALGSLLSPRAVVLRNDGPFRHLENLPSYTRVALGALEGRVEVREGGRAFAADPLAGQKTGWYYDQRDNRAFMAGLGRGGGRVLDVYCYGGGFGVSLLAAGAGEAVFVDSSRPALELARRAAEANGVTARARFVAGDAFAELARLAAEGARFRVVCADPPAFVRAKKELASGVKGYRKLARLAAALVEPGGFLFIASCSHNVEPALFVDEVAIGIGRAGRSGRIVRQAGAAADHPVHPRLPESAYLKALVLNLD